MQLWGYIYNECSKNPSEIQICIILEYFLANHSSKLLADTLLVCLPNMEKLTDEFYQNALAVRHAAHGCSHADGKLTN